MNDFTIVMYHSTKVGLAKVSRDFSLELARFDTNDFPQ